MRASVFSALLGMLLINLPTAGSADGQPVNSGLAALSELRWRYRVIIVLESPRPDEVVAALRGSQPAIDERDVVWFVLHQGSLDSNFPGAIDPRFPGLLERRFAPGPPVLLIGKDGGVKDRASGLDLPALFSRIDSMPMRRREMFR